MKTRILAAIVLGIALTLTAQAQVPGIINYQGRIVDGGTNFNGTGQFQFALLSATNTARQAAATANLSGPFVTTYSITDGGANYIVGPPVIITGGGGSGAAATSTISGGVVISITGTNAGGGYTSPPTVIIGQPPPNIVATTAWSNGVNTVSLSVTKGLYSVLLGDTTLANMSSSIPATVFTNADVLLRVWFNDGVNGLQQLSPDQRIAAAGYALNAVMAQTAANILPTSDVTGQRLDVGQNNNLTGFLATIAGGYNNSASAIYATVSGGSLNSATNQHATVGGGTGNVGGGSESTVAGGQDNVAMGIDSAVGGGFGNIASGPGAFIGGGGSDGNLFLGNVASGAASTIGGGLGNGNSATYGTIGGGYLNIIQSNTQMYQAGTIGASTISGGWQNTIQSNALRATIGGGDYNTIQESVINSTIGGGGGNTMQAGASWSTIGGGGR
jgi:hypothetical protein